MKPTTALLALHLFLTTLATAQDTAPTITQLKSTGILEWTDLNTGPAL